jgi:antiviral defense system Shedu protein SduA
MSSVNLIEAVGRQADALRSYFKDQHKLEMKALRPRGIILVGDTRRFGGQKEKDDLRLLSQGIKNITILTYDELLTRLKNYIAVLEEFSLRAPRLKHRRT